MTPKSDPPKVKNDPPNLEEKKREKKSEVFGVKMLRFLSEKLRFLSF